MPRSLILIAGYAGSGKTLVGKDLARRLPGFYLDKDTVASPLVEQLIAAMRLSAGDRDSPLYREAIRPAEYEGLIAAGIEAAQLGADVILSAPFLVQLADPEWTLELARQASACEVRLRAIWVACDRQTLRQRMIERGSPRDRKKLDDWAAYSAGLDEHLDKQFTLAAWRFENSQSENYDAQLAKLLEWLRS